MKQQLDPAPPLTHVDKLHELDTRWLHYSEHGPILLTPKDYVATKEAAAYFFAIGVDYGKRLMDRTAEVEELRVELDDANDTIRSLRRIVAVEEA